MLSNFFQLITRRPSGSSDHGFVQEVHVTKRQHRSQRMERLILAGWLLIVAKSGLIIWAVEKYRVPINPLWVVAPTVLFALVYTLVYFRGE
ncbi:MAG TPA: hypothetical protein VHO24_15360 [Opitutaceae bacterium]|nr:hypothetical protein [Opitutaceae bacterium]